MDLINHRTFLRIYRELREFEECHLTRQGVKMQFRFRYVAAPNARCVIDWKARVSAPGTPHKVWRSGQSESLRDAIEVITRMIHT